MLLKLTLLLALRSLILCIWEEKPKWGKIIDGFLACTYSLLFIIFFKSSELLKFSEKDLFLLAIAFVLAATLYLRLRHPFQRRPVWALCKSLAFCFFLILSTFSLLMRFHDDQTVMKITLTGAVKEEWSEWKNPRGLLKRAFLKSYEVKLETAEGEPVMSTFLFGEVVGLRAKVIHFHPLLNFIGIDNVCQVDAIYSGYLKPDPSQPFLSSPIGSKVWAFWETLFFQNQQGGIVKGATLESNYFPLIDRNGKPIKGSYLLKIHRGGILLRSTE